MTYLLLDWSIKVSVIFGMALTVVRLLRCKSAALRHWILSVAILAAAIAPGLSFLLPSLVFHVPAVVTPTAAPIPLRSSRENPISIAVNHNEPQEARSTPPKETPISAGKTPTMPNEKKQQSSFSAAVVNLPPEAAQATVPQKPAKPLKLGTVITVIWLIGMLLGLVTLAAGILRLWWIGRVSEIMHAPAWVRFAGEISRDYGLRRPLRLLQSNRPSILATWGTFRPEVLLPLGSKEWPEDRVHVVLSHELAHVRRGDWLMQILAEILRAFYWFNPLVWLACGRMHQESEQACDDSVLQRGIAGPDYAAHLLALARTLNGARRVWAPALMMARRSTLNGRFKAILNPDLNRGIVSRFSALGIAVVFLAVSIPVIALHITAHARPSSPAAAPAEVSVTLGPSPAAATASELKSSLLALLPEAGPPQISDTTSVEGVVLRLGTSEPVSGAEVELTRVEGTPTAPLPLATPAVPTPTRQQLPPPPRGGNPLAVPMPVPVPEVFPHAKTGADGKFVFRDLKPGKYTLVAAYDGGAFNPAEYGQRDPRGHGISFPLVDRQVMKGVKLEMAPTSSISGRISDENGEPLTHASVLALEARYQDGRRLLNIVQSVPTNERGEYRLFWLPPGQFYLAAKMEDPQKQSIPLSINTPGTLGSKAQVSAPVVTRRVLPTGEVIEETYGLVYYGGVADPDRAQAIQLGPGSNLAGADISIGAGKMRSHHIRGVFIGNPVTNQVAGLGATIRAIPLQWSPDAFVLEGTTDANGAFDLSGAVPGTYALRAGGGGASGAGYLLTKVTDKDTENVRVAAEVGRPIPGLVTIEGRPHTENDPDLAKIRVLFVPDYMWGRAAGGTQFSDVGGNGEFRFPSRHTQVNVDGMPPNSYVKAIRFGNTDILARGSFIPYDLDLLSGRLEIVIGTDVGAIEGSVADSRGSRIPNATLALIPDSNALRSRYDLYKSISADSEGKFQIQAIPAGDYKLFAWESVSANAWQDEGFLQRYEGVGQVIHIATGKTEVDLKVQSIPSGK